MAKTKALISCAVTAHLVCVFVFAYANRWFSHAKAHISDNQCFAILIIMITISLNSYLLEIYIGLLTGMAIEWFQSVIYQHCFKKYCANLKVYKMLCFNCL